LIGVSILGGIALALACSYRPIALWWVMVGCSAINVVRFGARLSRESRVDRRGAPAAHSSLVALVARALARSLDVFARARSGTSKASLDRQHARFLVWFAEHNLLWTTIGFGASLLLWHRFGPTTPALVVMAALMSCGVFAALGAAVGSRAPTLGLCWREPCRTPDLLSLPRIVHDVGCVVVLANRRDYAARCDWAKGGRFHELFLTVDDLARAGVEPGLEAVLAADGATARRALARKERIDRALAFTPVFAAGLLAAVFAIPPMAGSEPLPSLWTIVTRSANTHGRASANGDDIPRDLPPGTATSSDRRQTENKASDRSRSQSSPPLDAARGEPLGAPQGGRADGDRTSSSTWSDRERPDITGRGSESSITGDAVASARGDGAGAAGEGGARTQGGESAGSDSGSAGSGGASSPGEGRSDGSGGRGGGSRGYGSGGVAPQRAESPSALPDAPVNPGKAIEVVLPPFSQARDDSADDDQTGVKRKAPAPDQARAYRPRHDTAASPEEAATREPVQRWPNWVFKLLHK
jgi:hypothetical protein